MEAREKVDDSVPREMGYVEVMSFAHRYHKLDRWNISQWIRRFKISVVNVLSGFSHIEEALEFSVANDEQVNALTKTEMQLFTANMQILLVFEKACENDTIMTNKLIELLYISLKFYLLISPFPTSNFLNSFHLNLC